MIRHSDHPGRSAVAIHAIWSRKKTKTYFPVIPGNFGGSEVCDFLNDWLFKTGYIKSWEYEAEYKNSSDIDGYDMHKLLSEIFREVADGTQTNENDVGK